MKISAITLVAAGLAILPAISIIYAQDAKRDHRSFQLRTIPEPADPDPATQSAAERTAVLAKRMAEAKALLDAGKVEQCFKEYVDPFWLARGAASSEWTIDELFDKQILDDKQHVDEMAAAFSRTIESNLKADPKWLLNGRVASFITKRSSHTAEFWIYFEGKWRMSPET